MADNTTSTPDSSATPSLSGGFASFLKQSGLAAGEAKVAEAAKTKEKAAADYSGELKQIKAKEDALQPPTLDKLPEKPKTEERDPLQAFGSAAGWLAVFGGLLTKSPLTASLNAASSVMNAWRAQDAEKAKSAFEEWKVNTDNAIKLHEFQHQNYQDSLARLDKDRAGALAELKAKASAFDDQVLLTQLQHGDIATAVQFLDARRRMADSLAARKPALEQGQQRLTALYELQEARKSGDPARIQAALTALEDVNRAYSPSGEAALEKVGGKEGNKVDQVKSVISDIDDVIKQASTSTSSVTGLGGRANRVFESLNTLFSDAATPASDFASMIDVVKTEVPKLLSSSSRTSKDERARVDVIIRGMSPGDTRAKTLSSLLQLREVLGRKFNIPTGSAGDTSAHGESPVSGAIWSEKLSAYVVRDTNSPSGWSKVEHDGQDNTAE